MLFSKFSDRANHGKIADVKNDLWSDFRNNVYSSVGLSTDQLAVGQAAIDYGKNQVLPAGGAVPVKPSNVGSVWIQTKVAGVSTPMLIGGILVILAGVYFYKKGV